MRSASVQDMSSWMGAASATYRLCRNAVAGHRHAQNVMREAGAISLLAAALPAHIRVAVLEQRHAQAGRVSGAEEATRQD